MEVDNKSVRNQLYNRVEDCYNKHSDGYLKLDFEINHNFKKLHFIELYKYDGGINGDDFSFYFKDKNGSEANWYMSTIDITTLSDIVEKMEDKLLNEEPC